jgi:hypothetical protein
VDDDLSRWIETVPLPAMVPGQEIPGQGQNSVPSSSNIGTAGGLAAGIGSAPGATAIDLGGPATAAPARSTTGGQQAINLSLTGVTAAITPVDHRAVTGKWERIVLSDDARQRDERRTHGKVRMSTQDQMALSAFRRLYRKTFAEIIDLEAFAGNDLYARMLLNRASRSDDMELAAIAYTFLDGKGRPRLHRRAGQADVEL